MAAMHNNKRLLQNIFRSCFPYYDHSSLPLKDIKAAKAIMQCRTSALGYRYYRCPEGHEDKQQYHSCRHRSCALCAEKARHDWIERQQARLLDCPHYHVIFTLPHEYLDLWQYNREWFTGVFFNSCRDTLISLLEDERYLGATPGIVMTLHTWGRQLNLHPHIHCLVTAGGLSPDKKWQGVTGDFLLPIRVVKALYRGKIQAMVKAALKRGELALPEQTSTQQLLQIHRHVYKKEWSVRIQEQYAHGKGVMLYLSRYLKGSPLHPKQIIHCNNKQVTFRYLDHRDNKVKALTLRIHEFIRRLLLHVPVPGIHVVRHYGLYASQCRNKRNICREQIGGILEESACSSQSEKDTLHWACGSCGALLRCVYTVSRRRTIENSYIEGSGEGYVQQEAEADHRIRGPDPNRLSKHHHPPFFSSGDGCLA
jgi:putative transposase/transposase-like zinc-binding protein